MKHITTKKLLTFATIMLFSSTTVPVQAAPEITPVVDEFIAFEINQGFSNEPDEAHAFCGADGILVYGKALGKYRAGKYAANMEGEFVQSRDKGWGWNEISVDGQMITGTADSVAGTAEDKCTHPDP